MLQKAKVKVDLLLVMSVMSHTVVTSHDFTPLRVVYITVPLTLNAQHSGTDILIEILARKHQSVFDKMSNYSVFMTVSDSLLWFIHIKCMHASDSVITTKPIILYYAKGDKQLISPSYVAQNAKCPINWQTISSSQAFNLESWHQMQRQVL